jgi:UDP-N-acetylglucosamine:LPS N-acetylglucosamine transferase
MKKIPSLIHEQNSYAGITNKILKNRVNSIALPMMAWNASFHQIKL